MLGHWRVAPTYGRSVQPPYKHGSPRHDQSVHARSCGCATNPHSGECGYARLQTQDSLPTNPHSGECGYGKDDDVAAFARTRVIPAVATNPHSGECGYPACGKLRVMDSILMNIGVCQRITDCFGGVERVPGGPG